MLLKATAHWRELGVEERRKAFEQTLDTVFNGYPDLRMTHYATGAFQGQCTDVIVWETTDVSQYDNAIGALGEQPFFGAPLFEIVDVVAGMNSDDVADEAHDACGLPSRHVAFDSLRL
jgi:hypothetical protein